LNLSEKTTRITETAIITTLMAIFVIVGLYILPIIIMLFPIPFVILGVRHGIKYNILSIIASSLVVSILIDILTGAFVFILFGLLAILLAYMIRRKYKPTEIIVGATGVSLITTLLTINIIGYITGISFVDQINASFAEVIQMQLNMTKDMGLSSYELSQIREIFRTTMEYMIIIIPATIIISSLFTAYINYWVSGAVLKRLGHKTVPIPKFIHLRLPNNIILGTAVIFLATALTRLLKIFYYNTIFINVVILVSFVFFIQGLAVIVYLMNRVKMNKFLKGILIFLIIINIPLSFIISFIGVLDVIFDFRKLKKAV